MFIQKPILAENGAALEHHAVQSVLLENGGDRIQVLIRSYPTEGSRLAGHAEVARFFHLLEISTLDMSLGFKQAVLSALLQIERWQGGSSSMATSPTLAGAKERKWEEIKGERGRRTAGTFTYAGNTYNINRENLALAYLDAREALLSGELLWSQKWGLANNTVVTLTAPQMIAVARACKTKVSGLWVTGQSLRETIASATTVEQVGAVVWP